MNIIRSFIMMGCLVGAPVAPSLAGKKVFSKEGQIMLKNNTLAGSTRVEEVWQALQKANIGDGPNPYSLWKACLFAKKGSHSVCNLRYIAHDEDYVLNYYPLDHKEKRPLLSEEAIQKCDELAITHNGIIDEETQNIVISSYSGGAHFWEKHYPVRNWYESVPGYAAGAHLFKLKKFIFG